MTLFDKVNDVHLQLKVRATLPLLHQQCSQEGDHSIIFSATVASPALSVAYPHIVVFGCDEPISLRHPDSFFEEYHQKREVM